MKSALLKKHLQKQCKYYRCQRFADKTSYSFLKNENILDKEKGSIEAVIGVCEGRFFERLAGAMGAAQKVVLEQTLARWQARLFYIMLLWFICKLE